MNPFEYLYRFFAINFFALLLFLLRLAEFSDGPSPDNNFHFLKLVPGGPLSVPSGEPCLFFRALRRSYNIYSKLTAPGIPGKPRVCEFGLEILARYLGTCL